MTIHETINRICFRNMILAVLLACVAAVLGLVAKSHADHDATTTAMTEIADWTMVHIANGTSITNATKIGNVDDLTAYDFLFLDNVGTPGYQGGNS